MNFSEGKDFSIFLQGDIIREMVNEDGMSETEAALEWAKHSQEFRELVQKDPKIKELFNENPAAAREYVRQALGLEKEGIN